MKDIVETQEAVTFDFVAFSAAVSAFTSLKEENAATRSVLRATEGEEELALLHKAMEYGAATFDLQPLAFFVKEAKPSKVSKRIIKAVFPSHVFALVGDDKRPAFVVDNGLGKVVDTEKLAVVSDAVASGDGINCEQIKAAFPEPRLGKSARVEKLSAALVKRMKADGLTKADLLDIVKALA